MTVKVLTEITGTKYYKYNEEIDLVDHTDVRVFDENDSALGVMQLFEARKVASENKKDLVLRNFKANPPIVKVMHYRKELIKRLMKAQPEQKTTKDEREKQIRFSATISQHDLDNKKRQSIDFLKKFSTIKYEVKVNKYDPENIQKGRLILQNIAEDLKEYAKVKVSPSKDTSSKDIKYEDKSMEEMGKTEEVIREDHYDSDEFEDQPDTVVMVLKSTVNFQGVDIDSMLENANLDEFLESLVRKTQGGKQAQEDTTPIQKQFKMFNEPREQESSLPNIVFDVNQKLEEEAAQLRKEALMNLKKKRIELKKKSKIFMASLDDVHTTDVDENVIDLTLQVDDGEGDDPNEGIADMEDLDLIDATLNPFDIKSQAKKQDIENQIQLEQLRIRSKRVKDWLKTDPEIPGLL